MGNCCSGDHSKPEDTAEPPIEDNHPRISNTSNDTATITPFLRTPDTMAIESEMEKNFLLSLRGHQTTTSSTSSPSNEERKKMLLFDPGLVSLLDFFSHLYVRKKDLFRRLISVRGEELVEMLKKVEQEEERLTRPRIQPIQRSRSVGAGDDLKNEWMKIKTFKPDEEQPPGAQGSGGTKPSGGSK